MEYKWKVVKALMDDSHRTEFFYSDESLMDFLEWEIDSYDANGYCNYIGGSMAELIEQACRVGKEIHKEYGVDGIIEISKF
jgi:hypothetical protein